MPQSELTRSETARATAAAESRFRINAPNSLPRTVRVIAVDDGSASIVADLATLPWGNARFLRGDGAPADGELDGADLVVLVASAGADGRAARTIGAACRARGITTTALILRDDAGADLGGTLLALQPYCVMVVTTTSAECFADLLTALRA